MRVLQVAASAAALVFAVGSAFAEPLDDAIEVCAGVDLPDSTLEELLPAGRWKKLSAAEAHKPLTRWISTINASREQSAESLLPWARDIARKFPVSDLDRFYVATDRTFLWVRRNGDLPRFCHVLGEDDRRSDIILSKVPCGAWSARGSNSLFEVWACVDRRRRMTVDMRWQWRVSVRRHHTERSPAGSGTPIVIKSQLVRT